MAPFGKKSSASAFVAPKSSGPANVQKDWEQREFTQAIQTGVVQLTAFLNEFGTLAPSCSRPAARAQLEPWSQPVAAWFQMRPRDNAWHG